MTCKHCGAPESHYVSASLTYPGYYSCKPIPFDPNDPPHCWVQGTERRDKLPTEELQPCPFCGNLPSIEMTRFQLNGWKIYCATYDCMGPHTTAASFDDAAMQWNKRAPSPSETVNGEMRERIARVIVEKIDGRRLVVPSGIDDIRAAADAILALTPSPTTTRSARYPQDERTKP